MRPIVLALALLMFCSGCETKRVVAAVKPPSDRLQCIPAGERPVIPPEFTIDWSRVADKNAAKIEHEKFVGVVRTREKIVAGYIVSVEGKMFACGNNMEWLRDFFKGLPDAD